MESTVLFTVRSFLHLRSPSPLYADSLQEYFVFRLEEALRNWGRGGVYPPTYSSHLNLAVQGTDGVSLIDEINTARPENAEARGRRVGWTVMVEG
jgi:hypothetical protein